MKMNQRAAVYAAVTSVLTDNSITFEDGMNVTEFLTKEMRESVHAIVVEGFRSARVEFEDTSSNKEKLASESKLNAYVSGLISNWIRKDKRLNGNVSYVPKNPGSRAGQGDDQLKTLRQLKKQFAGTPKEREIDAFIARRVEELHVAKASSTKLTTEQLSTVPSELLAILDISEEA